MCVIIAKKIKDNISGDIKFGLFKHRDRSYDAKYKIKTFNFKKVSVLYLEDLKSGWIEGINDKGIKIVSAALDNHSDESNGSDYKSPKYKKYLEKLNYRNSLILKRALRQSTIEEALSILKDSLFIGNTFLSDGESLYSLEIAIQQNKLLDFRKSNKDLASLSFKNFKMEILSQLQESDFTVSIKDLSSKDLVVKTNHSEDKKGLGYISSDDGFSSSVSRKEIIENLLKDFDGSIEEIITLLSSTDGADFHKNPEMRPNRNKEKTTLSDKEKDKNGYSNYYTTDIFGLYDFTLYHLPLHSKVTNLDILKILDKDTNCHYILLKNINEKFSLKRTLVDLYT
jgi:hypothetical protein